MGWFNREVVLTLRGEYERNAARRRAYTGAPTSQELVVGTRSLSGLIGLAGYKKDDIYYPGRKPLGANELLAFTSRVNSHDQEALNRIKGVIKKFSED